MRSSIWFEKYKPQNLTDLILPENVLERFRGYIASGAIPNLGLWSVQPGLGKSSIANVIVNELGCEALWVNASLEKGIDTLRSKIKSFAERNSFDGKIKIVVMDECDALTPDAQSSFRAFLDETSKSCRFIFTGNYKNKLIDPLLDRLENYDFGEFKLEQVAKPLFNKCRFILDSEGVEYDVADVAKIMKLRYPGIRSIFVDLQRMSKDGRLVFEEGFELDTTEFTKVILSKDFHKIYVAVNSMAAPDTIFTFLYKNFFEVFGEVPEIKQAQAILTLGKYQEMSAHVRDKYLNACACLVELTKVL